jgi:mannose-6-phosphate isomerase-like protein (cupin superfamily)
MLIVKKVWGSEEIIVNKSEYCGKILNLFAKHRCSIHYHKFKIETFYILSGLVLMEIPDYHSEPFIMHPGDSIDILSQMKHRFTGLLDSKIIEFSSFDDVIDSYRDTTSEKISDDEWKEISDRWFLGKYDDFIID